MRLRTLFLLFLLFTFVLVSFGQDRVGRRPQYLSFQPSQISGLVLWLKAYSITGLSDGDGVATWTDASGLGRNFTQATSGNRPLYKVNIQNGKAIVRFDGSNDYLISTSINALTNKTVFAVVKSGDANSNYLFPMGNNNNALIQGYNGSVWEWYNTPRTTLTTISTTTFKIVWTDLGATQTGEWYLGSDTLTGDNWNGDIGELIVYDTDLSSGDETSVLNYLTSTWGL